MFYISIGSDRHCTKWLNKKVTWPEFCELMKSNTRITNESSSEYKRMSKDEQGKIKDVGGFVGGWVKAGRRLKGNIHKRRFLCLDLDNGPKVEDIKDLLEELDFDWLMHSTHKHTSGDNRIRIIIPTDREVNPDEFEFISRELSELLGFETIDCTCFQIERLMFWCSAPKDITPILTWVDDLGPLRVEEWIDKDRIHDRSTWKYGPQEVSESKIPSGKEKADPLSKPGLIGAFCRAWPISRVLDEIFPGEYEGGNGRYTLKAGSTFGGVCVYDDKFYYSYHQTDELGLQLVNAYDLVLEKKYGGKKQACHAWMTKEDSVKLELNKEEFKGEFKDWMSSLERNRKGECVDSYGNMLTILENEYDLWFDEFGRKMMLGNESLNDTDLINIHIMLERKYDMRVAKVKMENGVAARCMERVRHPIKEYLEGLVWDGKSRIDTILEDCYGVEMTNYHKVIMRKYLVACVKRIYHPGCKFDNALTFVGKEYVGKSSFGRVLAGDDWFSDDLSLYDMKDKTAAEKLAGNWIMEIPEMQGGGRGKVDINCVTSFLSRQEENYRAPFGKIPLKRKRETCFIASTNELEGFLKKTTGNRRYWIIDLSSATKILNQDLLRENRDQIWAEAKHFMKNENLWIDDLEVQKVTKKLQNQFMENSLDISIIQEYLDVKLPKDFNSMDIYSRRLYIQNAMGYAYCEDKYTNLVERDSVCVSEVWYELYGNELQKKRRRDSTDIVISLQKLGWKATDQRSPIVAYGRPKLYRKIED